MSDCADAGAPIDSSQPAVNTKAEAFFILIDRLSTNGQYGVRINTDSEPASIAKVSNTARVESDNKFYVVTRPRSHYLDNIALFQYKFH